MLEEEDDLEATQVATIGKRHLESSRSDTKYPTPDVHQPRKCPAWGKKCGTCHGPNHFAAVCKTKKIDIIRSN